MHHYKLTSKIFSTFTIIEDLPLRVSKILNLYLLELLLIVMYFESIFIYLFVIPGLQSGGSMLSMPPYTLYVRETGNSLKTFWDRELRMYVLITEYTRDISRLTNSVQQIL